MRLSERLILIIIPIVLISQAMLVTAVIYCLRQPISVTPALSSSLAWGVGIFAAGVVVGCYFLIRDVVKSVTAPLERGLAHVRLLSAGDRMQKIPIPDTADEVGLFMESLEQLRVDLLAYEQALQQRSNDEAVGRMAAQLVHDLRSPLTTLQIAVRRLSDRQSDLSATDAALLQMLLSSGSRLAQIVEALLAHRRDSIRKPEAFDLHTMLDELFYELQPQPIADGVFLHKAYAQRPITMIGDRLTLQRAIGNLMKNALEAMQGLTGRRCLQLTTSCRDGVLQLAIADTGPGMTAELMSRVMEGGHTEGKLDGNGIGMQVVNEAIAQHQGALRCDSERGAGTTFHITLPIIVAKSQEIADMHKTSEKRETIPTPGRILWNPPRVKAAIKHSA